ncbi:MAG: hypothetical protein ACOCWQ_04580 [Nanoarchaeota archaeon]
MFITDMIERSREALTNADYMITVPKLAGAAATLDTGAVQATVSHGIVLPWTLQEVELHGHRNREFQRYFDLERQLAGHWGIVDVQVPQARGIEAQNAARTAVKTWKEILSNLGRPLDFYLSAVSHPEVMDGQVRGQPVDLRTLGMYHDKIVPRMGFPYHNPNGAYVRTAEMVPKRRSV